MFPVFKRDCGVRSHGAVNLDICPRGPQRWQPWQKQGSELGEEKKERKEAEKKIRRGERIYELTKGRLNKNAKLFKRDIVPRRNISGFELQKCIS